MKDIFWTLSAIMFALAALIYLIALLLDKWNTRRIDARQKALMDQPFEKRTNYD